MDYSINSVNNQSFGSAPTQERGTAVSNGMSSVAQYYGVDVGSYYTTVTVSEIDEDGNVVTSEKTVLDTTALISAIKDAQKNQSNANSSEEENDSFIRTTSTADNELSEEEIEEADSLAKTVDNDYSDINKYMNLAVNNTALSSEWSDLQDDEFELTRTTATNTTVLEGAKEYISAYTALASETKSYAEDEEENRTEESMFAFDTMTDIYDKANIIEVCVDEQAENILGNNPFLFSAFATSEYEEELAV